MNTSAARSYPELVCWAYLGEVFGSAFLAELCAVDAIPSTSSSCRCCLCSKTTRQRLAAHLDPTAGLDEHIPQQAAAHTHSLARWPG